MKKNKMLRMASALMVLTLLTTSIIGGTFAKYTTTGEAADNARVAKWGVIITTGGSLYSDAYASEKATNGNLPAAWEATPVGTDITVAAVTQNDNIVAPGTKSYGTGLSLGVSGTPEVAVNVKTTITAEDIFLATGKYGVLVPAGVTDAHSLETVRNNHTIYKKDDTADSYVIVTASDDYVDGKDYFILSDVATVADNYFPVKYELSGGTSLGNLKAIEVAEKLAQAVDSTTSSQTDTYQAKYQDISKDFAAKTDLGKDGPKLGNENLTWEWKFDEGDASSSADTILGNLIAARDTTATINYKVVSIDDTKSTAVALTIGTGDDYTVKSGSTVVANLRTKVDINLTVTQID